MAGPAISTQVTVGITLTVGGVANYPTLTSPLTITRSGTITSPGNGVYASTAVGAATVVNAGVIIGGTANDDGINLQGGGYVLNRGAISTLRSFYSGILINGGGTIVNTAAITGGRYGFGVNLYNGGYVRNSGVISARDGQGVVGGGDVVTLVNSGTIGVSDDRGYSVGVAAGGSVTNLASGYIYGGVQINGGAVRTLLNYGTIVNPGGTGVTSPFGTIDNYGTIGGVAGVSGFATLRNDGTIVGSGGTAVSFTNSELMVLEPNGVIDGAIAGLTLTDTIDLAATRATSLDFAAGASGTGSLSVKYNGQVVDSFSLTGLSGIAAGNFVLLPDGSGGSEIQIVKYLTGTYASTVVVAADTPTALETTGIVSVALGNAIVNQGGEPAVVANFGAIRATGSGGVGVSLSAGGVVSNAGAIFGYAAGVAISGGVGTVVNAGTIAGSGSSSAGVLLASSYVETLTNYGNISGQTGVAAAGERVTVTNAGVVSGAGGTAVALAGGSDRLTVRPGAAFYGIADGGGGNSVLALAAPTTEAADVGAQYIGTLAGIGSSFVNFGTLVVEAGAQWEMSGDAASYPFINDGTIIVSNGIVTSGDTLVFGTLGEDAGDSGVVEIANYGTAEFTGAVDIGQTLVFADATGVVQLADPGDFAARISGFRNGDAIDLIDNAATKFRYSKGQLTLVDRGSKVAVLYFEGRYGRRDFH